jgi:hypothetical protein
VSGGTAASYYGMESVNEQGYAGYAGLSEPRVTLRSTRGYDPSPPTGALMDYVGLYPGFRPPAADSTRGNNPSPLLGSFKSSVVVAGY